MLIDWFTVAAQAVNFLVLVLLLKYLLFGRVVRAMDAREQRIADKLREADELRRRMESEYEQAHEENRALETQREARFAEIEEQVEEHRRRRTEESREEVRQLETQWRTDLERQKAQFLHDLRGRIGGEVIETARRTLSEMADEDLEDRMVSQFLKKLDSLSKNDREALARALDGNSRPLVIETSFPLEKGQRKRVQDQVDQIFSGARCEFATSAEIGCGIRLSHEGRDVAWSLDEYLDELAETVGAMFEKETHSAIA